MNDLAVLILERRALGLHGFLARICRRAYGRACLRGDVAARDWWAGEFFRWRAADRRSRRRDDGLCGGR